MPMFFDPVYFLFMLPPMLLALWANWRVKSTYAIASRQPAEMSGAAAARHVLDSAGLSDVQIDQIPGELTDNYDSRDKVLRLSPAVYQGRTMAAVGIACHEAGHALQDAKNYAPMGIRNAVVPVANFGSSAGVWIFFLGMIFGTRIPALQFLVPLGIALFGSFVLFQVVNLPVEFNASNRAKAQLVELGIVPQSEMRYVNSVLNAAAWTYVAATLQSVMVLLYLLLRSSGNRR